MEIKIEISKKDSKILNWSETPINNKAKNYGWSEDAMNSNFGVIYRLYYNNDKKEVYLLDITNDVTYEVPFGAKAKGYMIAFKLFSKV